MTADEIKWLSDLIDVLNRMPPGLQFNTQAYIGEVKSTNQPLFIIGAGNHGRLGYPDPQSYGRVAHVGGVGPLQSFGPPIGQRL